MMTKQMALVAIASCLAATPAIAMPTGTLYRLSNDDGRLQAILLLSFLAGLIWALQNFNVRKSKRPSMLKMQDWPVLTTDFWFDEFYVRRLATFLYFIIVWIFISWTLFCMAGMILGIIVQDSIDPVSQVAWEYLSSMIVGFLFLTVSRVAIELFIAVVKIAENTKPSLKECDASDPQEPLPK